MSLRTKLLADLLTSVFGFVRETSTSKVVRAEQSVTGGSVFSVGKVSRRTQIARRSQVVSADAPTITYSASAPAGRAILPTLPDVRPVGCALTYNNSNNTMTITAGGAFVGCEFILDGDTVTLGWRCQIATKERLMFFVDEQPVALTPDTPTVTTATGSFYYVTLAFASVAQRKIEILATAVAALVSVIVPVNASVRPTVQRRTIHIVGDSFNSGSDAITENFQVPSAQIAMTYDIDVTASALGGTGYSTVNGSFPVFGDASRVAVAAQIQPDEIIFMGSVNDDGKTGIQGAATACFTAYKAACPKAQIIVFGPQPSNATDTISANRKANCAAVQAACVGVALYIDMIGFTAGDFTAATIGMTAQPGQICSYLGSLWRYNKSSASVIPNAAYAPGGSAGYWTLLTMDYYGTGKAGSAASDGTRDVLLYSDGIHPMPRQCRNLAERVVSAANALTVF